MSRLRRYPLGWVDHNQPINWSSPVNGGLLSWWLNLPFGQWGGGPIWRDLNRGLQNDGALTGFAFSSTASPWQGPQGRLGGFGSLLFDGTNDYVRLTDPSGTLNLTGDITVAGWIRLNSLAARSNLITYGDSAGASWTYVLQVNTTGRLLWGYNAVVVGTTGMDGTASLTTGVWNHIAATRTSAGAGAIYINGSLDASATFTGSVSSNATGPGAIGTLLLSGSGVQFLNGMTDSVRVYNRALSSDGVRTLYNEERLGYQQTLRRLAVRTYYLPTGGLLLARRRAVA